MDVSSPNGTPDLGAGAGIQYAAVAPGAPSYGAESCEPVVSCETQK